MADWTLNLGGNLESKSLSSAKSVDILTAALRAEEKALHATEIALTRSAAAVGSVDKNQKKLSESAVVSKDRISSLKKQIASFQAQGQRPTKLGFIDAIEKSGGPIGGLIRNVKAAWGAIKDNPSAAMAVGFGVASVAAVGLAGKLYEVAKAALTIGVGFADEARQARLLNEAADIAGGSHRQLSGIIEDVNRRATIGKDRIAALGRELRIARFDSRQTQLTLSAMATAESALGQGASGAVRGIADASRATRRFSLGIRDAYGEYQSLKAAGLTKGEVFTALAKQLGVSTAEIQRRVGAGQISITRGMQAIEAALSTKFGANVAKQALGIDRTLAKLKEDFVSLFSGANIEPLLKGLNSISSLFSRDTAEGKAFGEVVSRVMNEVGKTIESLTPHIKEFIVGLGAEAAKPGGLAETIRGWISDAKDLGGTLKDVAKAITEIAAAAKAVGGAVSAISGVFTVKSDTSELDRINKQTRIETQLSQQGKVNGQALTAGIAAGIESGTAGPVGSITGLAAEMNKAWRAANIIQSPSKLYAKDATQIPAGVAVGVERATPLAMSAVVDMSAAARDAFNAEPQSKPLTAPGQGIREVHQVNNFYGIPGANEILPEIFRMTKHAVDGGPRPSPV